MIVGRKKEASNRCPPLPVGKRLVVFVAESSFIPCAALQQPAVLSVTDHN